MRRFICTRVFNQFRSQRSFYHVPVLRNECCEYLKIKHNGIYVDCTLGGGGHTEEILKRGGSVIGIDQDYEAIEEASRRLSLYIANGKLELHQANFKDIVRVVNLSELVTRSGDRIVDGVLFDLGISSHQIDQPSRGFAFRFEDCPLDMRMNQKGDDTPDSGVTAAHIVNNMDTEALADLLFTFGEEKRAKHIAREIVATRPHASSADLVNIVTRLLPERYVTKTLARCFQALRIAVNREMDCLDEALRSVHTVVRPGGRLVVLSYHSLEDRRIKELFRKKRKAYDSDKNSLPLSWADSDLELRPSGGSGSGGTIEEFAGSDVYWKPLFKKALSPPSSEVSTNSRARSAKLRVGERLISS